MGFRSWAINWLEAGRTKNEPDRQTDMYPFHWASRNKNTPVIKRTPTNLRTLSESPIPRRAINVIKDGIAKLEWSVTAINEAEQEKYQDISNVVSNVLRKPNQTDSFRLWLEQIVEDMLVTSAGASELVKAGDKLRPLRMFPVDAFSIELFANWDGKRDSNRYAQRINGKYVPLTDSEMMYIRMNPRTNTPFGLSPLETVWESAMNFIETHRSSGKQTKNTFLRKVLNLGKSAGTDAVKAFRVYWANEVMGQGVTPIIGSENPIVLDLGATDDKALFTIADTIAEHINNEIIEGYFKMGSVIQFKFKYAVSLKHGEVLLSPANANVIDINKTAEEQMQDPDPPPNDPNNPKPKDPDTVK